MTTEEKLYKIQSLLNEVMLDLQHELSKSKSTVDITRNFEQRFLDFKMSNNSLQQNIYPLISYLKHL